MRKWFLILIGSVLTAFTGKDEPPIHWNFSAKVRKTGEYELHFTATLSPGWHVYSQFQPKEAVADPTKINFQKNSLVAIQGSSREVGTKVKYEDQTAGIVQYQYANQVDFVQVISLKTRGPIRTNIAGTVHFQICTDHECLQPEDTPFNIPLPISDDTGK